ncbi:MAG: hypothetical protein ACOC3Z_00485 [Nanoarchaeota archaeon]
MNIGIVGSRTFNDADLMDSVFRNIINANGIFLDTREYGICKNDHITIISGGANGADKFAEKYIFQRYNTGILIFRAEWDNIETDKPCKIKTNKYGNEYNCLAGFNRNEDIVINSDIIIAFWDGESFGTRDTINKANKKNKLLYIINYNNKVGSF